MGEMQDAGTQFWDAGGMQDAGKPYQDAGRMHARTRARCARPHSHCAQGRQGRSPQTSQPSPYLGEEAAPDVRCNDGISRA